MKRFNKINLKEKRARFVQQADSRRAKGLTMRFVLILAFMLIAAPMAIFAAGQTDFEDLFDVQAKTGTTVVVATVMAAIGNVERVPNSQRTGNAVKYKLWLLSEDQYDDTQAFPTRTNRERGNIPLKAGEYWHWVEVLRNSTEIKATGEEGDFASKITNEITFGLGGISDEVMNLLEQGLQEGFFIVFENCSTQEKFLLGTACKPVVFSGFDGGMLKDYTGFTVTFKNESGEMWSKYTGNTTTQAPTSVAADATSITLTSAEVYQMNEGSASSVDVTTIAAVTDADVNRIITVLGVPGVLGSVSNVPVIVDTADFLLIDGEDWTANPGKQISFKIFKDGAGSYKFIEIAGSRV